MPVNKNDLTWKATVKAAPAICDIQAPDETIRVFDSFTVTVPGDNTIKLYECPAGKCAVIQYAFSFSAAPNPAGLYYFVKVGVQVYKMSVEAHVGNEEHVIKPNILLKAGDFFGHLWVGCIIGNVIEGTVLGYEISQY